MAGRHVVLHGYLGYHNVGDEAILAVTLQELRRRLPEAEPIVISGDPEWTRKLHGVEAVPDDELGLVAEAIRRSDLVISGGGGLLQDYWHRDNADLLMFPAPGVGLYAQVALLAELYGKPLALLAHGVGPIASTEGARLVRFVADLAEAISVRDEASRRLLAGLGVDRSVLVAPDPAFAFPVPPRAEARARVAERLGLEESEPWIAVSVRPWREAGDDWVRQVADGLDDFVSASGSRLLFVPFHETEHSSDLVQATAIRNAMREGDRCRLVEERPPAEVMEVIAACDAAVAMRLHAAIFAIAAGVPVLALSYDPKVAEAMGQAGQEAWVIPLEEVEAGGLSSSLKALIDQRDELSSGLRARSAELAHTSRAHYDQLPDLFGLQAPLMVEQPEATLPSEAPPARPTVRRTLSDELSELRLQLDQLQRRHSQYYLEKEGYIQLLEQRLRWARALGLMGPLWLGKRTARWALGWVKVGLPRLVPGQWRLIYKDLRRPVYVSEGDGQVTLYHNGPNPRPDYRPAVALSERAYRRRVGISLVVTVRDEAGSARAWLDSLLEQRRLPDELILVDGGSSDGTVEILEAFADDAPVPVVVHAAGPVNIAQGRNVGIERAAHSVIATTDFGCRLDADWLERLAAPFEVDEAVEVAVGWYEARAATIRGRAMAMNLVPGLSGVEPDRLLPSSRSLAFRKDAWERAGGYPEWLSLTAEDTYFALELRRSAPAWAFVPEARVQWDGPETLSGGHRKAMSWSRGDGEAGLFSGRYWSLLKRSVRDGLLAALAVVLVVLGGLSVGWIVAVGAALAVGVVALAAQAARRPEAAGLRGKLAALVWALTYPFMRLARVAGFVRGVIERPQALARRLEDAEGVVYILSGVPITDSGGGQRAAQLALGLLERERAVVFVNRFPSYETVHLDLHIGHPLLLTYSYQTLELEPFLERYPALADLPAAALVEFPLPEFVELAERLAEVGVEVVYDCIDDWATSLGGSWYSEETEQRLIDLADLLVATAEPLRERLERLGDQPAALVSNAVNTNLFVTKQYPRPEDLPRGEFVATYIGALWGEWFDWDLLREIALAYQEAAVVVIGDYRGQMEDPPSNLHFLGLKPQHELPAYLTHSDVALIPWEVSRITDATNPLKVYEYLAMHKPVVAPRIRGLEGVPYVLLADDHSQFIAQVDRARDLRADGEAIDRFIAENSWRQRVDTLLELLEEARG